ncbi:MAG: LLM class flavin-dependent oxidoreductase, partial [Chloroflexota bacterium]
NLHNETITAGSPATIREQVGRLVEATGCNYVICAFAWGEIPHAQALRSLRLFAAEVMPAFQQVGV